MKHYKSFDKLLGLGTIGELLAKIKPIPAAPIEPALPTTPNEKLGYSELYAIWCKEDYEHKNILTSQGSLNILYRQNIKDIILDYLCCKLQMAKQEALWEYATAKIEAAPDTIEYYTEVYDKLNYYLFFAKKMGLSVEVYIAFDDDDDDDD